MDCVSLSNSEQTYDLCLELSASRTNCFPVSPMDFVPNWASTISFLYGFVPSWPTTNKDFFDVRPALRQNISRPQMRWQPLYKKCKCFGSWVKSINIFMKFYELMIQQAVTSVPPPPKRMSGDFHDFSMDTYDGFTLWFQHV